VRYCIAGDVALAAKSGDVTAAVGALNACFQDLSCAIVPMASTVIGT
jgi:hypothetical protein